MAKTDGKTTAEQLKRLAFLHDSVVEDIEAYETLKETGASDEETYSELEALRQGLKKKTDGYGKILSFFYREIKQEQQLIAGKDISHEEVDVFKDANRSDEEK